MKELKLYLKDRKFGSIFNKNLIRILITLMVPIMLVFLISIFLINQRQRDNIFEEADKRIAPIATEMDQLWIQQEGNALRLCYDGSVSNFVSYAFQPLTQKKIVLLDKLQDHLFYICSMNDVTTNSVVLFSGQSNYIATPTTASTEYDMELAFTSIDYSHYRRLKLLTETASKYIMTNYEKNYITFYCSRQVTSEYTVYAFLETNKEVIAGWLNDKTGKSADIVLMLDNVGNYIAGVETDISEMGDWLPTDYTENGQDKFVTVEGTHYIVVAAESSAQEWYYVLLYPADDYLKTRFITRILMVCVLSLLVVFSIYSSWRVSIAFYRPIQIILSLLQEPRMGTTAYYQKYCRQYDEMNMIYTLIQHSYFRQMAVNKELEDRKFMLQRAQNYALAAQINPHFISNTLESINWKILNLFKGENEISTAMSDFSRLMRYTLNTKGFVRIIDEIDHARLYIKLCNTRSASKFTTTWDIDETVLQAVTPFLVIQPLVENAITHGMKETKEIGVLAIRCRQESGAITIEVEDNGTGIDRDKIRELEYQFTEDMLEESLHIGLVNTHHRIRLIFGVPWGVKIQSQPGKTIVSIRIPRVMNMSEISNPVIKNIPEQGEK